MRDLQPARFRRAGIFFAPDIAMNLLLGIVVLAILAAAKVYLARME